MSEMIGVRFSGSCQILYYDPQDLQVKTDQGVIVETDRGLEYGTVVIENVLLPEEWTARRLPPIVRLADEEDERVRQENRQRNEDAFSICEMKIAEHGLDMKLVGAEYTFDRNKLIFYFTADNRVDFRKLVRDLARVFHTRIELRQIGVRDQAKMIGGIGPCGQEVCCHRYINHFEPVSIKMAKTQGLSLNPSKISGVCGRLMCCLNYEQEVYKENTKKVPPVGSLILTASGQGYVEDRDVLQKKVRAHIYQADGSEEDLTFPVQEIEVLDKHRRGQPKPALWGADRLDRHHFNPIGDRLDAEEEENWAGEEELTRQEKENSLLVAEENGTEENGAEEARTEEARAEATQAEETPDMTRDQTLEKTDDIPYAMKGKARRSRRRGRRR